jgi:hypothetical protein
VTRPFERLAQAHGNLLMGGLQGAGEASYSGNHITQPVDIVASKDVAHNRKTVGGNRMLRVKRRSLRTNIEVLTKYLNLELTFEGRYLVRTLSYIKGTECQYSLGTFISL